MSPRQMTITNNLLIGPAGGGAWRKAAQLVKQLRESSSKRKRVTLIIEFTR